MKKWVVAFFVLAWAVFGTGRALAQFTADELAERGKWEEFLKTADITKSAQMKGDQAVTSPWELTLRQGDVVRDALWKNPEGRMGGYLEGWKYEIAAYLLDKHLGLDMVPPTIERRFRENRGSIQIWIPDCLTLKKKNESNAKVPPIKVFTWNRATYLQRAWDNLIANEDRHANQILITKDWRMILIDHSRSFRFSKKYTKDLIYGEKGKEGTKLMSALPRAFLENIKALTFDGIRAVVGSYLSDEEINAVLLRRDLILTEINRLISKNGEDQVLY
jgi:hypothetical protein